MYAYNLLTFEKRLQNYHAAEQPRVVVVGPSYSYCLGEFNGIYNLSLNAANPREVEQLMRYCSPNDTILYFCTLADLKNLDSLPRATVTNPLLRRAYIMATVKFPGPEMVIQTAPFAPPRLMLDFTFYDNLLQRFPHIIFVIQPLKFGGATPQAILNYWDTVLANYPSLDLRQVIGDDDLYDVCHYNDRGIRKVQTYLAAYFNAE